MYQQKHIGFVSVCREEAWELRARTHLSASSSKGSAETEEPSEKQQSLLEDERHQRWVLECVRMMKYRKN